MSYSQLSQQGAITVCALMLMSITNMNYGDTSSSSETNIEQRVTADTKLIEKISGLDEKKLALAFSEITDIDLIEEEPQDEIMENKTVLEMEEPKDRLDMKPSFGEKESQHFVPTIETHTIIINAHQQVFEINSMGEWEMTESVSALPQGTYIRISCKEDTSRKNIYIRTMKSPEFYIKNGDGNAGKMMAVM